MRPDGRQYDELRPVTVTMDFIKTAEGSVLFEMGGTRVICTASIEDKVPPFMKDSGKGWVTAEYALLPRSTDTRTPRESSKGKVGGRTHEIQRLIGRSLRSVMDMAALGERTIWIDCDVIQADGGTRTASITGAWMAMAAAVGRAMDLGMLTASPIRDIVSAISVGVVDGKATLDLCYKEDYAAEVDMNVVMTGTGQFVEVQGTAERRPFGNAMLAEMLGLAEKGIMELAALQRAEIPAAVLKSK
jgi:ribonuclease PH